MIKWHFTSVNLNPTHWYSTFHGKAMRFQCVLHWIVLFLKVKNHKRETLWQKWILCDKCFLDLCFGESSLQFHLRFKFWFCLKKRKKVIEYLTTPTPFSRIYGLLTLLRSKTALKGQGKETKEERVTCNLTLMLTFGE